jgi:CRP-like cAMP-binding protein
MADLATLRSAAAGHVTRGEHLEALAIYDAIVAAAPLDLEARLHVADQLAAVGQRPAAIELGAAVARDALRAGSPLLAVVAARVIEAHGGDPRLLIDELVEAYAVRGAGIAPHAGRLSPPPPDLEIPPQPRPVDAADLVGRAARRALHATDGFTDWPAATHPIPLLSRLGADAFRRVLTTLVVRRLPDGAIVLRAGDPGESFFFVATGAVRVIDPAAEGGPKERATLRAPAIFGEMALVTRKPRSATVEAIGETDLIEVTRASLGALAGELEAVAIALTGFTRDRLLDNLAATHRLFRPFSPAQRRELLRRFTIHDVATGAAVIQQGEEGRGLFIVLSGELEVSAVGQGAEVAELARLRAGDVFGEVSLLRGGPAIATVTARTPATVLFLARENIERLVDGVHEIEQFLVQLAEVRAADTEMVLGAAAMDDADVVVDV